ncbi:phenylacetate--CoA ligase family protein [Candidatus Methylocalor cossyra]|uniref:Phenylacetate-CoA ligase n=1 Tax=Candidatus Methylocalor cossyra TaxID=3108543 RepID=A0ABM9NFL1_9GAMM
MLGRSTFALLANLEKTQWLSRDQIEQLQLNRLTELLRIAHAHCPWHAERIQAAGLVLEPGRTLTLDEFRRLPTMTKADASAHRERLVWRQVPGGLHRFNTGGSSGQPLIFYYGRARQAADVASRLRAHRWWGVEPGDPEVFLWGAPIELNGTDFLKTLRDRLFNQLLLNAFAMSEARMDDYLGTLQRFDPVNLFGYASSLALLAAHAKRRGRIPRLKRLKLVCTTGEPLYPQQRRLIEEVFGVPVSNEYGCRDGGTIALESPDGQLLVNSETLLLEILDPQGRPVAPGEIGEAVITNLYSEAQPFIRYRTGDMVRRSAESCKAGRGLPVIAEVIGRTTDFIVRPDGTIMHALAVIYVLRAIEGIDEFKIIQPATDRLEVLIRPSPTWTDRAKDTIVGQLRQRMGSPVAVDIALVERIAPEASGKHRYVVSHVALPDTLELRE